MNSERKAAIEAIADKLKALQDVLKMIKEKEAIEQGNIDSLNASINYLTLAIISLDDI